MLLLFSLKANFVFLERTMKFDLTFLINPNEKASFDKPLDCSMVKSYASSFESNPASRSDETDGDNDHILGTSMGTTRSTSIPLPSSHVPRTQSELQLSIDEEAAEQRDARMFYRLVNGIRERQQHQQQQQSVAMSSLHCANSSLEDSISRLVRARLTPLDHCSSDDDHLHPEAESDPHEVLTASDGLPPAAAEPDSWSISGYDHEEQKPSRSLHRLNEGTEEEDYHDDEAFFELDF